MEKNLKNTDTGPKGGLLSQHELKVCKRIAASEPPYGQRAAALIAIHTNGTQAEAAEQTGLSPGQVKYWAAKFKSQRLRIFPDNLLETSVQETDAKEKKPVMAAEDFDEPGVGPTLSKPPKKKKKDKQSVKPEKNGKAKKGKKKMKSKDGDKKSKKNKKKKKEKKSKKK